MTTAQTPEQMLREFHESKAIHGGLIPEFPTADIPGWVKRVRGDLLHEEINELGEAVESGDIAKIADALGDIVYVAVGTAVAYGIPFDAVLAEVHRSNMTKDNSPAKGKLIKGPGYEPPRIAGILGLKTPVTERTTAMTTTEAESPCDFHCGYYSSGRALYNHIAWEHRDCTECGVKAPERPYSLTHRPDCPRLQQGYVYPATGSGYAPYDGTTMSEAFSSDEKSTASR